ncbi:hypothetical protein EMCRGX_G011059 [Ephydatia muelleri]
MPILSNPFIGSFRSPYGDVVSGHNRLRDALFEPCRQAGVGGQTEVGSGLGHDERRTWPADVLVPNWDLGKPAAFDLTVTSPLNSILKRVGYCILLAVETYGCWGAEARVHLSRLASCLAARLNITKSQATFMLYSRLNLVLVRANARALLSQAVAYDNGSDPI